MASLGIAVFFEAVQLSDIVGVDILSGISRDLFEAATREFTLPNADILKDQVVDMKFLYVSSTLEPAATTQRDLLIKPTHTYETVPVDEVDIILIGGPWPSHRPAASLKLLQDFATRKGSKGTILTTCTGSLWLADAGLVAGRRLTTNRAAIPMGRTLHPEAEWVDQRWVVDDKAEGKVKLWTSGAAAAGMDMVATYAIDHFPKEVVDLTLSGLDYDPSIRGIDYPSGRGFWEELAESQKQQEAKSERGSI